MEFEYKELPKPKRVHFIDWGELILWFAILFLLGLTFSGGYILGAMSNGA